MLIGCATTTPVPLRFPGIISNDESSRLPRIPTAESRRHAGHTRVAQSAKICALQRAGAARFCRGQDEGRLTVASVNAATFGLPTRAQKLFLGKSCNSQVPTVHYKA